MSEVNSREKTKQDRNYSPQQTSPVIIPPKHQKFPERQFFDPPQIVSQQPEINHPENSDIEFPEVKLNRILKQIPPIKKGLWKKYILG